MNRAITDIIKFVCCIGIFIHHFYLHSPYVQFLGPTACVIFFCLSAYGISVSLEKKPMTLISFLNKRLFKIYLPLLMVNILFVVVTGWLCNIRFGIPVFNVFGDRIDYIQDGSAINAVLYTLGVHKIDSVTWFLDVLFVMYLFIWVIHKIANKTYRVVLTLLAYCIHVLVCSYITPPIMFGMIFDPIGIVVGVFLAEKKECLRYIQSKSNLPVIAISCFSFLSIGFMMGCMPPMEGRYTKLILLVVAVISIISIMAITADKYAPKANRLTIFLGGISYFIYLTHEKIANIVFYYNGSRSLILTTMGVGCISALLYSVYLQVIKRIYG